MPKVDTKKQRLIGTASYDNWRAFDAHMPVLAESEHLIYTDARLTGQVETGLGPYVLLNLTPTREDHGRARPAFVLRASHHVNFGPPDIEETEQSRYHGGWMIDEIAALASLKCGCRLRAGSQTRRFEVGADAKGTPVDWGSLAEPNLNLSNRRLVLPTVAGEYSIMGAAELISFPALTPSRSIVLMRAARLYQDALWLAESEPNLSWLMLVSAVETAANAWQASNGSPIDKLAKSRPEFVKYLRSTNVDGLAERVASEFAESGITKKFIDFLLEHLPEPPQKRPPNWAQVEWSKKGLKKAFSLIYRYRSKALHDAMPFPAPMCISPLRYESSWEAVEERPAAKGIAMNGGAWVSKDLPMHLHLFEYIARNAINAWWSSIAAEQTHDGHSLENN